MPTPGRATPASTRRKISRAQQERHRRGREQAPPLRRGRKRCNVCREWKVFDLDNLDISDFGCSKQRRRDGSVSEAPCSECRRCHAEKQRGRERKPRRATNKTPERREYLREWARWKRATQRGDYYPRPIPPTAKDVGRVRQNVDPTEFLAWLAEWLAVTGTDERTLCRRVAAMPEAQTKDSKDLQRTLYRWRWEGCKAHIRLIDLFATAMGMPDQVACLYPLD